METYIIILIIFIILLIFYLVYKNIQEYKTLEKFSTQSSLSTYFKNTIDSNDYEKNNKSLQHPNNIINKSNYNWNGIWQNSDIPIISQF
jgi:cell division protein FtsX